MVDPSEKIIFPAAGEIGVVIDPGKYEKVSLGASSCAPHPLHSRRPPGIGKPRTTADIIAGAAHFGKVLLKRGVSIFQAPIKKHGLSLCHWLQEHGIIEGFFVTSVRQTFFLSQFDRRKF